METLRAEMPSVPDEEAESESAGVRIRAVEDVDVEWPLIWPLVDAYERHHATLLGGKLLPEGDREHRARQDLARHRATTLVTVADDGQGPVAAAFTYLGPARKDGRPWGYGNRLYVEPPYRGRGIAARFEGRALRWLRDHGVTYLEDRFAPDNHRRRSLGIACEAISMESRKAL
jgi:GNAT superfamily N-acetyltransferase